MPKNSSLWASCLANLGERKERVASIHADGVLGRIGEVDISGRRTYSLPTVAGQKQITRRNRAQAEMAGALFSLCLSCEGTSAFVVIPLPTLAPGVVRVLG